MEPQAPTPTTRYDSALLIASATLLIGGMAAFYALAAQLPAVVRLLLLLAAIGAALAAAYRTEPGRGFWGFLVGARAELRKVVWPTRQESLQMTLMIAVVVLITSLLLWGLDSLLLFAVKAITGRG